VSEEIALTKLSHPPYQNNMFLLETQEHEIQWLLNEFEEKNLNKREGNCKKK
jgi:hypothetical protein